MGRLNAGNGFDIKDDEVVGHGLMDLLFGLWDMKRFMSSFFVVGLVKLDNCFFFVVSVWVK